MTPALQADMLKERIEGIEQSVSRISQVGDPSPEAAQYTSLSCWFRTGAAI
jgi:hypothetical protein